MKYLLAHGVKEGLVDRVEDWPGVHSAGALLHGKPLAGYWFDRTKEYAARNRGEDFGVLKYASREELVLSALPRWEHLPPERYRERVAGLIEQIEVEGRAERESKGVQPLGVEAILRQNPTTRPSKTKKSPAPRVPAVSKAARERLLGSLLRARGRLPGSRREAQGRRSLSEVSPLARSHLRCPS